MFSSLLRSLVAAAVLACSLAATPLQGASALIACDIVGTNLVEIQFYVGTNSGSYHHVSRFALPNPVGPVMESVTNRVQGLTAPASTNTPLTNFVAARVVDVRGVTSDLSEELLISDVPPAPVLRLIARRGGQLSGTWTNVGVLEIPYDAAGGQAFFRPFIEIDPP